MMKQDKTTLLFAVPLVSPQRTSDWGLTQRLFERTLRSICAQTSSCFQVVVACHERPRIDFAHPAVHYVTVDHALPADERQPKRNDKHIKMRLALHHGEQFEASHTMVVDADDMVSNRLAEFVSGFPGAPGWYLDNGYFYSERSGLLHYRRKGYYRWTGTSLIIARGIYPLPEHLHSADLENEELMLQTYYRPHSRALEQLRKRGLRLEPLPFAGSMYAVEHGTNLGYVKETMYSRSAKWFKGKLWTPNRRRMSAEIRAEYGFYEL